MARILIVDDDEEMCEELKDILKADNHSVTVCNNGQAGMDLIENNDYDFVLLDMKMPQIRGHEVLKYIKDKFPAVKVIILTGSPLEGGLIQEQGILINSELNNLALRLADDVMNKPFDPALVLSKIKKLTK